MIIIHEWYSNKICKHQQFLENKASRISIQHPTKEYEKKIQSINNKSFQQLSVIDSLFSLNYIFKNEIAVCFSLFSLYYPRISSFFPFTIRDFGFAKNFKIKLGLSKVMKELIFFIKFMFRFRICSLFWLNNFHFNLSSWYH